MRFWCYPIFIDLNRGTAIGGAALLFKGPTSPTSALFDNLSFLICIHCISLQTYIKMVDKLAVQDSRVQYKSADLNGRTYSYILGEPQNGAEPVATIFLIHGVSI